MTRAALDAVRRVLVACLLVWISRGSTVALVLLLIVIVATQELVSAVLRRVVEHAETTRDRLKRYTRNTEHEDPGGSG